MLEHSVVVLPTKRLVAIAISDVLEVDRLVLMKENDGKNLQSFN